MSRMCELTMYVEEIETKGFAIIPRVLDSATVAGPIDQLDCIPRSEATKQRGRSHFGIRNLLKIAPFVHEIADSTCIRSIVEQVVGRQAQVVRGIFLDKTPEANWKVAWHQDITIAVRQKKELVGFKCWSRKAGVTHVQPPAFVLEKMLALRLHLDDTTEESGALKVIPGSHRHGRLSSSDIERIKGETKSVSCPVEKGGALAMRPLLLHSSSLATAITHRRVIHLEFASLNLPGGMEWQVS
jgi:ectoine hydroxylase-related dioxygenase (phytanoyl-CoA dioxygenase family)